MKKKIGIVAPFQNGDLITATSVLQYRDELWPDCDIVWFCNNPHDDALKFQDIELRHFPHGWGILENDITGQYSERVKKDKEDGKPEWQDWTVLMTDNNTLNQSLKSKFRSFEDLSEAYFPIPWMVAHSHRNGLSYPVVSKKIFKIPDHYEWHPVLYFSEHEREMADYFFNHLPKCPTIACETFAGSGQSKITDIQVIDAMDICRRQLGKCNFIFTSHKFINGNETFPEGLINNIDVFSIANFTVRQTALVTGKCDLMISVSSGTTVAASCWGNNPVPILAYCGSEICSTRALALGEYILVTHDDKSLKVAWEEFKIKLIELLNKIK